MTKISTLYEAYHSWVLCDISNKSAVFFVTILSCNKIVNLKKMLWKPLIITK